MVVHNRRKLPGMRRVSTYITPEQHEWLRSFSEWKGYSVSCTIALLIDDAHVAEQILAQEAQAEQEVSEGR